MGEPTREELEALSAIFAAIGAAVGSVVLGQPGAIRLAVTCLVAGGHLLLEDVPGVGKTTLARSLAQATGTLWQRIQCTPDLLPSDLTGVHVPAGQWDELALDDTPGASQRAGLDHQAFFGGFVLRPGPIFAQLVMADELNRASPRTQAALLEAMEERQVSLDGTTYRLPEPFFVIATQNPGDFEGTYPLPESQLDRFLMRVSLGYPPAREEAALLGRQGVTTAPVVTQVTTPERLIECAEAASRVYLAEPLRDYLVSLARATRDDSRLHPGASPRALLGLAAAARVWAASEGRSYVLPDDVIELAPHVLAHRLALGLVADRLEVMELLGEVLERVPVPLSSAR